MNFAIVEPMSSVFRALDVVSVGGMDGGFSSSACA
jgi:hypothetical protein